MEYASPQGTTRPRVAAAAHWRQLFPKRQECGIPSGERSDNSEGNPTASAFPQLGSHKYSVFREPPRQSESGTAELRRYFVIILTTKARFARRSGASQSPTTETAPASCQKRPAPEILFLQKPPSDRLMAWRSRPFNSG